MTTPATAESKSETTIVTEIPPSLHRALLMMVKTFYSNEHFLIVYYVMKAVCVKEENLRRLLQFDQRQLRQQIASLKADKLIKERLVSQKNDNNRSISIIYYFVNYRAVINVLRYKIDHMRMKLEAKEKEDVQKAMYKCKECGSQYETLEVDRILDPYTQTLKCWRCQGEVAPDETGGPSQSTRSLLARFNDEITPFISAIQELTGIQLAPHLLEPDITLYQDEDAKKEHHLQEVDFSQRSMDAKVQLGARQFNPNRATELNYIRGDDIVVDLNADANRVVVEEARAVPAWLQDNSIAEGSGEHAQAAASLSIEGVAPIKEELKPTSSSVTLNLLAELEGAEPERKKARTEEEPAPSQHGNEASEHSDANDDDDEEEEELLVRVQGKEVPLGDVDQDMIQSMTDEERQHYTEILQQNMY